MKVAVIDSLLVILGRLWTRMPVSSLTRRRVSSKHLLLYMS